MAGVSIVKTAEGQDVQLDRVIAGYVQGENVSLTSGMAGSVVASNDAALTSGGALAIVAGRDITVTSGGGEVVVAGRDLSINGGGAGLLKAQNASVQNAFVGVVLSGKTELGEGARVLLDTKQACALGAGIGVGIGLGAALGALLVRIVTGRKCC